MPLPKPNKGEKKKDFVSRCMGNAAMVKEFPKQTQRAGVCYSQWKDVHGKSESEPDGQLTESENELAIKSNFEVNASNVVKVGMRMEVSNVRLHDVGSTAQAGSPFANLPAPDRFKAYMDFDIVHCLPAILGPVSEGFFCAYLPQIVARSHGSLLHQQVNLNHLLKVYSEGEKNIPKDRIVGCVIATWFPSEPLGGWKIGADAAAAPSIRARAVIFKLADGVNRMLGDHQASRKEQSVSIETTTSLDNLGIYLPSRGADKIVPLMDVTEEAMLNAISLNPLKLGKINDEQGVFVFGVNDPVEYRGVGVTGNPAERQAKIVGFHAEKTITPDGGTLIAMAAEQVNEEVMEGRSVKFKSGRIGKIEKVITQGEARLPGISLKMKASADNPVLDIVLPDNRHILRKASEVAESIAD